MGWIEAVTTLKCPSCGKEKELKLTLTTGVDVERAIANAGWRRLDGNYLCPECWAEYNREKRELRQKYTRRPTLPPVEEE